MTRETVRVPLGAQPHFRRVRVGVMRVGEHRGVRKARLLIRDRQTGKRVDLVEGETADLLGAGTVRLDQVHLPEPGGRGEVTLSFDAEDA